MTTRQRLDLLARAYPRLFPRADLLRLLRSELGHVDALDQWIQREGGRSRARASKTIYHICAGNLAISAQTSLVYGLLLGSHNVIKLPSEREDSTARREITTFIKGLPFALKSLVKTHHTLDPILLRQAEVVIAFGSDATMEALRAQTGAKQKFIAHGHALSLLWLADPNRLTPREARACAVDVLTYDQLGCLSPQAVYVPTGTAIAALGAKLSRALEAEWLSLKNKPARPLSTAARIIEARDVAHALGHQTWLPKNRHLGWTLIHDPDPTFRPSPLHGVIYLRRTSEIKTTTVLASVTGRISTVGQVGQISSRLQKAFLSLGVSRFCPAGRMQFPPLTWHHDGRSTLRDLVTWSDAEAP